MDSGPGINALVGWMETLDEIPGTVEYEDAKRIADSRARSALGSARSISEILGERPSDLDLLRLREVSSRVFPDAILDPSYILHDSRLLEVAQEHQHPVQELLPSGFFTDYQTLTCGSLTPSQYDFLVSLNALGAWAARNVRINIADRYFIFPPCSVLLVSMNPGLGKGQALQNAKRVLQLAGYGWIAPDRVTVSKFLGILYERSQADLTAPSEMAIMASELAGFFRDNDQATAGMIMDLADLMDMPTRFTYATRRHDTEEIRAPTVSVAGASNMEWLTKHMPAEAFTGGWIPRQYVSVQAREHAPKLNRDYPPPHGALQRVIKEMLALEKFTGAIRMTPDCTKLFVDMRKRVLVAIARETDERKAAYLDRRPTNTLRMAMMFAYSQHRLMISAEDMDNSDKMIGLLEETHYHLYNHIGMTLYARWKYVTYDIIRRTRDIGLSRSDLKAHLAPQGMKMADFDGILEDLADSDLIYTGEPRIENGKPIALIRATDPDREINEVPTRRSLQGALKAEDAAKDAAKDAKVVKSGPTDLTSEGGGPILGVRHSDMKETGHEHTTENEASEG